MPQAALLAPPDATPNATSAVAPGISVVPPSEQATTSATADTRSEEQRKIDERREYLENQSLAWGVDNSPGLVEYAPEFAISLIILGLLFIVTDKRKPAERKGWRAWLRGRF